MGVRLISPTRRRIVDRDHVTQETAAQLRKLGWAEYYGPGKATQGQPEQGTHKGTRNGWYIPGTDPDIDKLLKPVKPRTH